MKTEAIKAKEAEVKLAGVTIKGYQLPDGSYRASLSQVLEAFGISRGSDTYASLGVSGVLDLGVQRLKVARSNGLRGATNINTYLLTTEQLNQVLLAITLRGVKEAGALLVATANETWQRRFDAAFGVEKTELNYDQELRDFFRELARKSFHPKLTAAMNGNIANNRWGTEVNNFKKAAGLRLVCVDEYTKDELESWSDAMSRYNCLVSMGRTHKQALVEIHRQRLDREVTKA